MPEIFIILFTFVAGMNVANGWRRIELGDKRGWYVFIIGLAFPIMAAIRLLVIKG